MFRIISKYFIFFLFLFVDFLENIIIIIPCHLIIHFILID